ncbi:MAG TPA: hypothetical protein VM690_03560, partial [Gaiellaceae bacterium]|nr:hypothetical protein [Gaiellaceae bacterium]
SRLTVALLLAAGIPLCQSLEGLVTAPLYLRSRYDVASIFLAWSMALRLTGVVVGAHFGLDEAIAGVLAAQALASVSVGIAGSSPSGGFRTRARVHSTRIGVRSRRSSRSRASRREFCRCAPRSRRCCSVR